MASHAKTGAAERKKFGKVLAKLRIQNGHSSAYGFFHGCGGRKYFGFTYNHYLMVESGQRLPGMEALKRIVIALTGTGRTAWVPERRELLVAYLRALSEGESIFDIIWDSTEGALGSPTREAPVSPTEEIVKDAARRRVSEVPRLTSEQGDAVSASPAAFWCHQWLLQTGRSRKPETLARDIGVKESEVKDALEALFKAGVLDRSRAGAYRSKFWETDVYLPANSFSRGPSKWLSREIDNRRGLAPPELSGGNHGYFFLTLESEKEFITLTELFRETMRKAYLYRKRGPITGKAVLCSAEWRFFRIFKIESEK